MNTLMQSLETKQAMSYSRQHFTSLVGLAHAFKTADATRSGVDQHKNVDLTPQRFVSDSVLLGQAY
jgi:hypothetical protein